MREGNKWTKEVGEEVLKEKKKKKKKDGSVSIESRGKRSIDRSREREEGLKRKERKTYIT